MISSLLLAAVMAGQCGCPAPTRYNYTYAAAPATYAAPAIYSLLDSSGRVWTHTDLAVLKAHVARVNASLEADPAPTPNPGRPQVKVPPSPYVKPARPVVSATPDAAAGEPTLTDLDRKITALEAEIRSNLCRCRVVEAAPPPADFRFQ